MHDLGIAEDEVRGKGGAPAAAAAGQGRAQEQAAAARAAAPARSDDQHGAVHRRRRPAGLRRAGPTRPGPGPGRAAASRRGKPRRFGLLSGGRLPRRRLLTRPPGSRGYRPGLRRSPQHV
ncbi:MAG: hypothetical protein MZW92_06860 [Comamonadaceae bacterium]|nr:hypothetical protein [Comamonadaceae bacterium]